MTIVIICIVVIGGSYAMRFAPAVLAIIGSLLYGVAVLVGAGLLWLNEQTGLDRVLAGSWNWLAGREGATFGGMPESFMEIAWWMFTRNGLRVTDESCLAAGGTVSSGWGLLSYLVIFIAFVVVGLSFMAIPLAAIVSVGVSFTGNRELISNCLAFLAAGFVGLVVSGLLVRLIGFMNTALVCT